MAGEALEVDEEVVEDFKKKSFKHEMSIVEIKVSSFF